MLAFPYFCIMKYIYYSVVSIKVIILHYSQMSSPLSLYFAKVVHSSLKSSGWSSNSGHLHTPYNIIYIMDAFLFYICTPPIVAIHMWVLDCLLLPHFLRYIQFLLPSHIQSHLILTLVSSHCLFVHIFNLSPFLCWMVCLFSL